jgi:hypothetical protein
MKKMDSDGSGEVEFEEFFEWYKAEASELKRDRALKTAGLVVGNFISALKGLGALAEAKRIIISHAEHDARERAIRKFRLIRPPIPQLEVQTAGPLGLR